MDITAMFKISYGLYVLTARNGGFANGCIINTLSQVTSNPNRVCITVNKSNYTNYMIRQSGEFNVSVIDESADFSLFRHFGFASGRWENKFYRFTSIRAENNIPYVAENTCAYFCCKVVQTVELGTHTMFIADVTDCRVLSDRPPMTYSYYHAAVKPKPAVKKDDGKERWVCNICGYIYEGRLPADFVCPVCKHGAEDFSLLK
ncbi:flavin reductase [Ruminococcus sp. Marseille-P6503]|uniref:flavin reductase n=1 Tax=Ruminococcus sp. Marseille-P6503 TaxID=2364796 RepID=UPI000F52F580|nr:flavin reductase [Ruminococcus sp. Marseille-P6503]